MQLVHPYFRDEHPVMLDEEYYKQFMAVINPENLPYRDYAPLVKFVKYQGCKHNVLKFFVPNRFNGWETYIQFREWDQEVNDRDYNAVEAARLLLWGANLRLHCGCPAYRFWGFQYILTKKEAAIVPEKRYPTIRNPHLKGVACKHLIRTLKVLPFHLGDMAREIKNQREEIDKYGTPQSEL